MKKVTTLLFFLSVCFWGWSQNLPIVDFTGFTGSNLSTIAPGWSEANSTSSPSGTTSSWTRDDFGNVVANGDAAKINLFNTGKDEWIISPSFLANANSQLEFDLALTDFGNTDSAGMGSDDSLEVRITTDGWVTYTPLATWTSTSVISNVGQHETISLAAYAGQTVNIAFYGSEGTTNDPEDVDVFIDNIEILNPLSTDLAAIQITSPTGADCFSAAETITVMIKNTGLTTVDFTATNATVGVDLTGAAVASYSTTVSSGMLMPDSTMMVTVTTIGDFSVVGSYSLSGHITYPGDLDAANDSTSSSLTTIPTIVAPFTEDFETGVSGSPGTPPSGWIVTGGSYLWYVENDGVANSGSTGPVDDHTPGGTKYMYTEASSGGTGNVTELSSPCIDMTSMVSPKLRFWYHMYGADMGTLRVDAEANGIRVPLDSLVGQQQTAEGDPWLEKIVDLTPYAGQTIRLIFVGIRGTSFTSDMSVDDIEVFDPPPLEIIVTGGSVTYDCGNAANAIITVDVTNLGTMSASNVLASFTVDGGAPITPEVIGGTLVSGDDTTYTFITTADLSAAGPHTIVVGAGVFGEPDTTNNSFVINVNTPITITAPFTEDFETGVAGSPGTPPSGWTVTGSNYLWYVETDGTQNSLDTGPLDDHTPGGSTYMYTEATSGSTGNITELWSPCIDLSALTSPKLSYWYHMYGADMGTLKVDVLTSGVRVSIDSISGQQQTGQNDAWLEKTLDLSAYAGQSIQLIWVGIRGSNFTSDISIDDINLFEPDPFDLAVLNVELDPVACGLDSAEVITINVMNFGTDTINGAEAQLSVNGGAYSAPESIPTPIAPGDTVTYSFTVTANLATAGLNTVAVVATSTVSPDQNTSNDSLSVDVENVPSVTVAFPYQEDFEGGAGLWTSGGTNSSWDLSTPANTVINSAASGSLSWVTNDTSDYNPNENSWVASPCMDLTNAPANSWVSMKVWWESEFSWDGANLQTSTDGGSTWTNVGAFGDPNNWYTDNTINGAPGGSQEGWSGRNSVGSTGSGGWVVAAHPLDSNIIGNSAVRFRVNFGSDGAVEDEGFAFDDFGISEPPAVQIGDTMVVCGTETLDAGYPGSTYSWSTGDVSQTITLINNTGVDIIDSLIRVTVVDTFGLVGIDSVLVTIPASIPAAAASVTDNVACNGDSTGSAQVVVAGGNTPYMIMWDSNPGQMGEIASNLPAGNYTVTVVDSFGCEATDTVMITENPAITVALDTIVDVLCAGDSTGSISITVGGGVAPYGFMWDNGDTNEDISGLPAGTYVGEITDSLGCSLVSPALNVTEPDSIAVTLDDLTDNQCPDDSTGSISISVSGGVAPYSFMWSNGDTTEDVSGLPVGDYTGMITDANGCELGSPVLTIGSTDSLPAADFDYMPVGAAVNFSNTTPNGTSYIWAFGDGDSSTDENPTHLYTSNDTFVVTLTVANDCGTTSVTDTILVTQVGIEDALLRSNVSVYPNPNTGNFEVKFDRLDLEDVRIKIHAMNGAQVYEKELGAIHGFHSHKVSLPASLARGVYMIEIRTSNAAMHQRFLLD